MTEFRDRKFTACNFIAFSAAAIITSLVGVVLMLLNKPDPPNSERVKALLARDPIWVEDPPLRFSVFDEVCTWGKEYAVFKI